MSNYNPTSDSHINSFRQFGIFYNTDYSVLYDPNKSAYNYFSGFGPLNDDTYNAHAFRTYVSNFANSYFASNEAPTDIILSKNVVAESQPVNTIIGNLSSIDPNADDTFTYTLVSGRGSDDNSLFAIINNQLQTNAILDYETKNNYSIRVQGKDKGGLTFEKQLNIALTNIVDAPVISVTNTVLSSIENSTVSIDPEIKISDTDSANLVGAYVSVFSSSFIFSQDQLNFTNQNGISGSFNPKTQTLELTGLSSVANYQAALRSITFTSSVDAGFYSFRNTPQYVKYNAVFTPPDLTNRTIAFSVNNGTYVSNPATRDLKITFVNAPHESNLLALATTDYGQVSDLAVRNAHTHKSTDGQLTVVDELLDGVEDVAISVSIAQLLENDISASGTTRSITSVSNAIGGTVNLDQVSGFIKFIPNLNFYGKASFDYTVTDSAGRQATAKTFIDIAAINDNPVISNKSFSRVANLADMITSLATSYDTDRGAQTYVVYNLPYNAVLGDAIADSVAGVSPTYYHQLSFAGQSGMVGLKNGLIYWGAWSSPSESWSGKRPSFWQPISILEPNRGKIIATDIESPSSDLTYKVLTDVQFGKLNLNTATGDYIYSPNLSNEFNFDTFVVEVTDKDKGSSQVKVVINQLNPTLDSLVNSYASANGSNVTDYNYDPYKNVANYFNYLGFSDYFYGASSYVSNFANSYFASNLAPTDIILSKNVVAESQPVNTIIGNLSSIDPNADDTFFYSLVPGRGSDDNSLFTINTFQSSNNQLLTNAILDYETKSSYSIRVQSIDKNGLAFEKQFNITLINANDAPVVTATNTVLSSFENSTVAIDPNIKISDIDSANLVGASVRVFSSSPSTSSPFIFSNDLLNFTNQNGITGSFNSGSKTLELTGLSSVANYQAALRSITFTNVGNLDSPESFKYTREFIQYVKYGAIYKDIPPDPTNRTVEFKVNDGTSISNLASRDLKITLVNDSPIIVNQSLTVKEGNSIIITNSFLLTTDVDNTDAQLVYILKLLPVNGTLQLNGASLSVNGTFSQADINNKLVTYSHNGSETIKDSFNFDVSDAVSLVKGTAKITVTPVNDAPVIATTNSVLYYLKNTTSVIDPEIKISDVDSVNLVGATVKFTSGFISSEDRLNFSNQNGITGNFNVNTGVLTLTGTSSVANYQAALKTVKYSNSSNNPNLTNRSIQFSVNDGLANSNLANRSITIAKPGAIVFTSSTYSVNEDGKAINVITLNRTNGSDGAVSVTLNPSNGTASTSDYKNTPIVVNFAHGEKTKTVAVPIINDTSYELNETINLTLSTPTGGAIIGSQKSAVLTIIDNDAKPGAIAFNSSTYSVNEDGKAINVITLNRTNGSDGEVSITLTPSNGTASTADYKNTPIVVTFANGEKTKTVAVPITNDTSYELNETINLTLSKPTGGAIIGSQKSATLTIIDNDAKPGVIAFNSSSYSINEDGKAINAITLTRTNGSDGAISVTLTPSNGTASTSDYKNTPIVVTFANGEKTKTVAVPITNDTSYELNETINLTLSKPTGGAIIGSQKSATLTIIDNDAKPGVIAFNSSSYSINEDGKAINAITLTRTNGSDGAISVTLTPSNGTASTSDYKNTPIVVTFANGEKTKTVVVPIINDTSYELNETINLTLSKPTGGAIIGSQKSATLTIIDNDAKPGAIAFTSSTYSVNENGKAINVIILTRTNGSDGVVSVTLTPTNGTASTSDYKNTPIVVNFANGEKTKTVTVPIINDTIYELNETINLTLSKPTGGAIIGSQKSAVLTIIDNDLAYAPKISVTNPLTSVEGRDANSVFTVSLSAPSLYPVSLNYNTVNQTAISGSDYTATQGILTFAPNQTTKTINVSLVNDNLNELDKIFALNLSNPTNAILANFTAIATITDTLSTNANTTLSANVENLTLTGSNNINGTGNALNNTITGNAGNNVINGGAGNDSFLGGAGSDTLTGGLGSDRYLYQNFADSPLTALDRITDFTPTEGDRIVLKSLPSSVFNGGVFSNSTLSSAISAAYTDANPNLAGNQALVANQAVFFGWNGGRYVSVNDGLAPFNTNTDLVVNVTGLTGTMATGALTPTNYFAV